MRPTREHATRNSQTYMITSSTWGRRALFSREAWAKLLIDTLYHYRGTAYLLHDFVVMPDHVHVLFTPKTSLEKAVQFIKGGFSYRAKKELGSNMEVWQKGFSDHRIRDASDYLIHQVYVQQNPVRKHLCDRAEDYLYSSANGAFKLDPVPQGLKPASLVENGTARLEGEPFQNKIFHAVPEGVPFQSKISHAVPEGVSFQNKISHAVPEDAPFQNKIFDAVPEDAPFQNKIFDAVPEDAPFQNTIAHAVPEGVPFQNKISHAAAEDAPFQTKIAPQRSDAAYTPAKNKTA